MAFYNEEHFIQEAIESILHQSYTNFEFLIFDDGSSDDSFEIVKNFIDDRIILFYDGKNKGLTARLNEGITLAKGEYIARMDADDISLTTRLEKQVKYLEQHQDIGILGTNSILSIEPSKRKMYRKRIPLHHHEILAYQLFYNPFVHPTIMIRSRILKKQNYPDQHRLTQDYFHWLQLLKHTKGANLKEVLLHYRIHQNNSSANHEQTLNNISKIFTDQFKQLKLPFTIKNLQTHLLISESNPRLLSINQLREIKKWLEVLLAWNQENKRFPKKYFSELTSLVYLECWLWKVKNPMDYLNLSESPIFKSNTSLKDKWRLFRSFLYRIRHLDNA